MSGAATKLKGTFLVPGTEFVPVSDRETAEKFAAVILPFSVGELARAGNVTKDTAKAWKAGRSAPHAANLFMLARTLEPVRAWAQREMDPALATTQSNRAVMNLVASLQQLAHEPGQEGAEARAILAAMNRQLFGDSRANSRTDAADLFGDVDGGPRIGGQP